MKLIWQAGSGTVRDIYEALRDRRAVAYTTVQTMMNILETKGHLKRQAGEKANVYSPVRPQQAVVKSMVREFVDRVFDGASRPMLLHLVKQTKLSDKERKALLRAIEEVEE